MLDTATILAILTLLLALPPSLYAVCQLWDWWRNRGR
jgi:hypothetical protein